MYLLQTRQDPQNHHPMDHLSCTFLQKSDLLHWSDRGSHPHYLKIQACSPLYPDAAARALCRLQVSGGESLSHRVRNAFVSENGGCVPKPFHTGTSAQVCVCVCVWCVRVCGRVTQAHTGKNAHVDARRPETMTPSKESQLVQRPPQSQTLATMHALAFANVHLRH